MILIAFSPVVSGSETAMIPGADFSIFPLANPGLISIPLGFFLGWLGSVTSTEFNRAKYAEMEVRSLTGHGVAEMVEH
jgi:cation/acetate symporter